MINANLLFYFEYIIKKKKSNMATNGVLIKNDVFNITPK